jgi:hypothetical protein
MPGSGAFGARMLPRTRHPLFVVEHILGPDQQSGRSGENRHRE